MLGAARHGSIAASAVAASRSVAPSCASPRTALRQVLCPQAPRARESCCRKSGSERSLRKEVCPRPLGTPTLDVWLVGYTIFEPAEALWVGFIPDVVAA